MFIRLLHKNFPVFPVFGEHNRQTDRQTERERQTDRQRERERETDRQTERERERDRGRETLSDDVFQISPCEGNISPQI